MPFRILFAGSLDPDSTATHRASALERLGYQVTCFDFRPYLNGGQRWQRWLRQRLFPARSYDRLCHDLQAAAKDAKVQAVWIDKGLGVDAATVRALRHTGAAVAHYSSDTPFVNRGEPSWRRLIAALPAYDLVVVPSPSHIAPYRAAGATALHLMPFGYEPTVHFPPPPRSQVPQGGDFDHDVCFIGTPYGDRAAFLAALARDFGIRVAVFGGRWDRRPARRYAAGLDLHPEVQGDAYRQTLWRSRIALGFVTHAMGHDTARRWAEVPACGTFLLAEHTGNNWLRADVEAAYFTTPADCAARIRDYLADEPARQTVAVRGMVRVRAERDNDRLMAAAIECLLATRREELKRISAEPITR